MQQLLDNPFLLLFLGIALPTVLYMVWGVIGNRRHPGRQVGGSFAWERTSNERHCPPTSRVWWKQPLDRVEGTWIAIASSGA